MLNIRYRTAALSDSSLVDAELISEIYQTNLTDGHLPYCVVMQLYTSSRTTDFRYMYTHAYKSPKIIISGFKKSVGGRQNHV